MANEVKVGQRAVFKGYTKLEEGFDPLIPEGHLVEITKIEENGNYVVVGISEDGTRLNLDGQPLMEGDENIMADQVWPTEIEVLVVEAAPVADAAPVVEAAPADFSKMDTKAVEDFVSRNGIATPDGWAKLKLADKRKFLIGWEAANAATTEPAEEVAEPEAPAQSGAVEVLRNDSDSVRNILAESDAIEAAKVLLRQGAKTDYTLGGVLAHIDETGAHKRLGYDGKKGFEQFCIGELDIEYRKARYLIAIYTTFRSIGVDEVRLEQIGWSKAKELARIKQESLSANLDNLLAFAGDHTRDELIQHIKTNYEVASRADQVKTTTFTFKVVEDVAETVKQALASAKTAVGEDDPNKAFAHICGDWINTAEGSDLDLEAYLALGMARFGKTAIIEALDAAEEAEEVGEPEVAGA